MTKQDHVVYMTKQEFDELLEYSTSIPTGTTVGKMWKRGQPARNPTRWLMGEYEEIPDRPAEVGIHWRDIVIGNPSDFIDYQI